LSCGKTKITIRPMRTLETYHAGNSIKVGDKLMKKDYHRCNEKVLCDKCRRGKV